MLLGNPAADTGISDAVSGNDSDEDEDDDDSDEDDEEEEESASPGQNGSVFLHRSCLCHLLCPVLNPRIAPEYFHEYPRTASTTAHCVGNTQYPRFRPMRSVSDSWLVLSFIRRLGTPSLGRKSSSRNPRSQDHMDYSMFKKGQRRHKKKQKASTGKSLVSYTKCECDTCFGKGYLIGARVRVTNVCPSAKKKKDEKKKSKGTIIVLSIFIGRRMYAPSLGTLRVSVTRGVRSTRSGGSVLVDSVGGLGNLMMTSVRRSLGTSFVPPIRAALRALPTDFGRPTDDGVMRAMIRNKIFKCPNCTGVGYEKTDDIVWPCLICKTKGTPPGTRHIRTDSRLYCRGLSDEIRLGGGVGSVSHWFVRFTAVSIMSSRHAQ